MAVGDSFGNRGPQIHYTAAAPLPARAGSAEAEDSLALARALDLARQIEELLEDTRSVAVVDEARTHSTRMARAMAAGLVDELEALVQPARKAASS